YGWAGNRQADGGFYRVRATGKPAHAIVGLHARVQQVELQFSDPLDLASATNRTNYAVKVWSLERTANYGSKHIDEHPLKITRANISSDKKSITLTIPELRPTWCMEIKCDLRAPGGGPIARTIHNTIHHLDGVTAN